MSCWTSCLITPAFPTASIPLGSPSTTLGAPLPGATRATVNMAHVVAAIEFSAGQYAEGPGEIFGSATQAMSDTVGELRHAAEDAVEPHALERRADGG